jgi:hypothetical protein
MRARAMIDGATFGAEALKAMGKAFDDAWQEIASQYDGDPERVEAGRLALAQAVISVAYEESRDAEVLKQAALQIMQGSYGVPRVRAEGSS